MPKKIASELDWIVLGIEKFAEGGEAALIVEKLARQLGSSKTSFYWYFKDRSQYVSRIIAEWKERATTAVIARNEMLEPLSPQRQVQELLLAMFSFNGGGDFLFYLRKLGEGEAQYGELLRQIEQQRLTYMSDLLVRCGHSQVEAERASELVYSYYLGWYERYKSHIVTKESAGQQAYFIMAFIGIGIDH
ncbi:TetR/AcrR family transcriptional regulator [Paenibacillus harenae]|uniref:AcrR family transcriptional regulator n=1 Tax=Paenibacillus harenae TaxID=306543 RepID=A0ABT9TZU0_PAEHA|nr:TetR/AcrR family transcriptional regulator [Paenibacillus harenae]MDQ0112881.1 AcrR family transcriptional regulator [Paenibacillus harenae]